MCILCVLYMHIAYVCYICTLLYYDKNIIPNYVVLTLIIFYQIKQNAERTSVLYVYCVCVICIMYACCVCVLRMRVAYAYCVCVLRMRVAYACCVCVLRINVAFAYCICALLYYDENIFSKYSALTSIIFYKIKQNAERTCILYVCCVCVLRVVYAYFIYALLYYNKTMFLKYVL